MDPNYNSEQRGFNNYNSPQGSQPMYTKPGDQPQYQQPVTSPQNQCISVCWLVLKIHESTISST